MKSTYYLNQYNSKGFVKLENIFSNKDVDKILSELEKVKSMLHEIKKKKLFHKTKDGKINTIHNIQEFYRKNKFEKIANKKFLNNVLTISL